MNRKWILLNLLLVALAASLVYLLRQHYLDAQAHERAIFERAAHAKAVPPPPPLQPLAPVTPAQYFDVAQRNLFSSDRNPNVIVEAPKPAPPPPPMPALPSYFGQIGLGGEPSVLLKPGPNDPQKRYHAGEKVGLFQLVSFDQEKIVFKWNDKDVERKLSELTPKEAPPELNQPAAPQAQQQSSAPRINTIGGSGPDTSRPDSQVGTDIGGGFRACVTGDNSPAGTVVNGYKKIVVRGMMGNSCRWEPVQK